MAIFLSRRKNGEIATPIVPDNTNPVPLVINNIVNPRGAGYAIADYINVNPSSTPVGYGTDVITRFNSNGVIVDDITDITPSNTPTSVASGDNIHIGGSGVIVDSVPTPTSLTPSNSTPATITSGATYTATTGGKAIASYSEVAPSNANPPEIYNGGIYKIKTRNGYLISTINIVVPSDSNPPLLSNDNSWYRLNGASGYLYSTQQPKVKTGTFTTSTSATTSINCGFKPKYLAIEVDGPSSSGTHMLWIYNQDTSTSSCYYASASNYPTTSSLPSTSNNRLGSIDSNGFTFNLSTSRARTARYFAIG